MSVIIKSNQVATQSFALLDMLNTTPELEFAKYKARVLADGGVIRNEARTLAAFTNLFNTKHYGHMNTFVSGHFGVKITGGDKIAKLYAINGMDMIGKTYGTGVLPKITADNAIDFTANTTSRVNGGLFVSERNGILSKAGRVSLGVRFKGLSSANPSTLDTVICGISASGEVGEPISGSIMYLKEGTRAGSGFILNAIYTAIQDGGVFSSYTDSNLLRYNANNNIFIHFISATDIQKRLGYRDLYLNDNREGVVTNSKLYDKLDDVNLYVYLGGMVNSSSDMYFYNGVVYDFMSTNHIYDATTGVNTVGFVPL